MLLMRLVDTGIGVAVGLAVNVLVWPPFRDRAAARSVDRIDDGGTLLCDIAAMGVVADENPIRPSRARRRQAIEG